MASVLSRQMLSRNRRVITDCSSGIRKYASSLSFEAIEKAAARHAANHFITSMDNNSNYIDTPTICVSDPANISSWEWCANLDSKPKLTAEEILKMSKSCQVDAFQLVEKDISTLSGTFYTSNVPHIFANFRPRSRYQAIWIICAII